MGPDVSIAASFMYQAKPLITLGTLVDAKTDMSVRLLHFRGGSRISGKGFICIKGWGSLC